MYNLLIADDESNIRLGIKAMIEREFPGEMNTFLARDGFEALDIMSREKIDLLITDIKMPRMNGIELIRTLQESDKKPILIILSGYDDFEYTKAAIKCKVKDYLLKPVNRNELFQTVRSSMEDLEKTKTLVQQEQEEEQLRQIQYILLNPLLSKERIKEICGQSKLKAKSGHYFIAVMNRGRNFFEKAEQVLKKEILFLDQKDRTVILTEDQTVLDLLKQHIPEAEIGCSGQKTDFSEIREAYLEAAEACKYSFVHPRHSYIDYKTVTSKPEADILPIEEIKKIKNMLGTIREQEIKSLLLKVLDHERITAYSIDYLESIHHEINRIIYEPFFERFGEESKAAFKKLSHMEDLYSFRDFYHYFHETQELILRLHEYMKQLKSISTEQTYMEQALAFIGENYQNDLNLAVVSNHISLNYSYFSHVFKENTGQNFVDYLKKVRIENSKRLLQDPDLKIFEVSDRVGYKNPKQFARVFRELEGISPKEFREAAGISAAKEQT